MLATKSRSRPRNTSQPCSGDHEEVSQTTLLSSLSDRRPHLPQQLVEVASTETSVGGHQPER